MRLPDDLLRVFSGLSCVGAFFCTEAASAVSVTGAGSFHSFAVLVVSSTVLCTASGARSSPPASTELTGKTPLALCGARARSTAWRAARRRSSSATRRARRSYSPRGTTSIVSNCRVTSPRTRSAMASRLVRLVSTSSAANAWMLCPTLGRSSPSATWETCPLARNRVLAAATASLRDNSVRPLAASRYVRTASTTMLWCSLDRVGREQNEGAWRQRGVFHAAGTHGQRYRARTRGRTQTSKPVLLRPNPRERAGDEA